MIWAKVRWYVALASAALTLALVFLLVRSRSNRQKYIDDILKRSVEDKINIVKSASDSFGNMEKDKSKQIEILDNKLSELEVERKKLEVDDGSVRSVADFFRTAGF